MTTPTETQAAIERLRAEKNEAGGVGWAKVTRTDLATALAEIDGLRGQLIIARALLAGERAAGYRAGQAAMRERIAADQDCGGPPLCVQPQRDGRCIRTYGGECPHQMAREIRALPVLPEPQTGEGATP